ncbi:nuclear transport factor 2 family protein [Sphingorhabdus sp. M41]|uniref:nuclear transport factor 2 family protein n=1 Tax=Sphingorhabdus sp. M41 TaxID=1806885 RepID=UPI00078D403A|nr:nuclear transport factor 2 family protein [Sphingorhabdus sp. M41]AMO70593.1 hypothetical protein AZE99_00855 [Sphingorhabdus sp. M41]
MNDEGLGALLAREEIGQQIYNYCRAVDRLDAALGYAVWHEDGTADYGEAVYQGTGHGFIDFVIAAHGQMLAHSHQVTNVIIELDGDMAASEAYHFANLRMERDGQLIEMRVCGRYLDRWSRRDGRWAIDHRLTIRDFDSAGPVMAMSQSTLGSRDLSDPSYEFLEQNR